MDIAQIINENFMLIFYSIFVIIILAIIAKIFNTREREKTKREIADINLKSQKLDMVEKEKHVDNLKEAAMVLKDSEKSKLDEISKDKSILSRRSLYLMNQVEERTQRLERGADNAKLMKTLKEIKNVEKDLFGDLDEKGGEKR